MTDVQGNADNNELCTGYSTLDRLATHESIKALFDSDLSKCVLDIFTAGSRASADFAAAHFGSLLLSLEPAKLEEFADAVRPIPASVSLQNAPSLAKLCLALASLRLRRPQEKIDLSGPLVTFTYAEPLIRNVSIEEILLHLTQMCESISDSQEEHATLSHLMVCFEPYLTKVLKPTTDKEVTEATYVLYRLLWISESFPFAGATFLDSLLRVLFPRSVYMSPVVPSVLVQFSTKCINIPIQRLLVYTLVVDALEQSDPRGLICLLSKTSMEDAPNSIKVGARVDPCDFVPRELMLLLLAVYVIPSVHRDSDAAERLLSIIIDRFSADIKPYTKNVLRAAATAAHAAAIASFVGGKESGVAVLALELVNRIYGCDSSRESNGAGGIKKSLVEAVDDMRAIATQQGAGVASRVLSIFSALLNASSTTSKNLELFYTSFQDLLEAKGSDMCSILCAAGFYHEAPKVRIVSICAFAKGVSPGDAFSLVPVAIDALAKETNAVVSERILQVALCGSNMLDDHRVGRRVVSIVYKLSLKGACSVRGAAIAALGAASERAPQVSFPFLLRALEKVNQSKNPSSTLHIAACWAILEVVKSRPSRGVQVIPFLQKMIGRDAVDTCPEAASLAFAAMSCMTTSGVLDEGKTVRIVLKTFHALEDVPILCQRQYLRLISSVAHAKGGKKRNKIKREVINVLKGVLVDTVNQIADRGHWDIIEEAAAGLNLFKADDVLRIKYRDEAGDIETERNQEIEREAAAFCEQLIRAYGLSVVNRALMSSRVIEKLLQGICLNEWSQRVRGAYDSEKLLRMKATSEALRRRRQAGEDEKSRTFLNNEEPTLDILKKWTSVVDPLPDGAIKVFVSNCSNGLQRSGKNVSIMRAAFPGVIQAVKYAGALVLALPWAELLGRILVASETDDDAKVCAIEMAHTLEEKSTDVADLLAELRCNQWLEKLPRSVVFAYVKDLALEPQNYKYIEELLTHEKISMLVATAAVEALEADDRTNGLGLANIILAFLENSDDPSAVSFTRLASIVEFFWTSEALKRDDSPLMITRSEQWSRKDVFRARIGMTLGDAHTVIEIARKLTRGESNKNEVSEMVFLELCNSASNWRSSEKSAVLKELLSIAHECVDRPQALKYMIMLALIAHQGMVLIHGRDVDELLDTALRTFPSIMTSSYGRKLDLRMQVNVLRLLQPIFKVTGKLNNKSIP